MLARVDGWSMFREPSGRKLSYLPNSIERGVQYATLVNAGLRGPEGGGWHDRASSRSAM